MTKDKNGEHKTVSYNFRITPALRREFQKKCREEGYNASEVLRILMEKWLKEKK